MGSEVNDRSGRLSGVRSWRGRGRSRQGRCLLALLACLVVLLAACSSGDDAESADDGSAADAGDSTGTGGDSGDGGDDQGGDGGSEEEGRIVSVDRPDYFGEPAEPTGATATSSGSGRWNDGGTWAGGSVPAAGDHVVIEAGHEVVLDSEAKVDGMAIVGTLEFDADTDATIGTTANLILTGTLRMKPADPDVDHVIEFLGVDEAAFLGDGMAPLDPDTGLWVVENGQMDLQGAERRSWSTTSVGIEPGATTIAVDDATGWRAGDEVAFSPTAAPSDWTDAPATWDGFSEAVVASVDGNTITLEEGLADGRALVADRYGTEVMNLTRNVVIRGTSAGRGHVFVHSDQPQFVRWVALDRLGVTGVTGRYPLHFHHSGEGSRGTLIEGVAVRDGGNHAFVPHESHGITMRDLVAFNIEEGAAYWWDLGDQTNDLLWEHVMSARTLTTGFFLGRGDNVTIRDAVATGVASRGNHGGFQWDNGAIGLWKSENLVSHNNNNNGILVWQNSSIPQVVDGYAAYHNAGPAIFHGAYTNRYTYRNAHFHGNWEGGVILQAVSRDEADEAQSPLITFENILIDSAGVAEGAPFIISESAVPASQPVLIRNVTVQGEMVADKPVFQFINATQHELRCVDCTVTSGQRLVEFNGLESPEETWLEMVTADSSKRYRPVEGDSGASYDDALGAWVGDIDRPVPATNGTGVGLTAEYFEDPGFQDLAYTTVLPSPIEDNWSIEGTPYYRIDASDGASVRWSGDIEIEPDQGGRYTFHTAVPGGLQLWIDDELLISDPDNDALNDIAGRNSVEVELEGGQTYRFEMEISDRRGGEEFGYYVYWTRPNGFSEILPTSQLHPRDGVVPDNDPEVALAASGVEQ